jgi:hypothetical protein
LLRVLLLNPASPARSCAPPLGLEHIAASLQDYGCEVRVIDANACHFRHSLEWIIEEAEDFGPDIAGISLYTNWVLDAYRLAEGFRGRLRLLVAGGPHATACPDEVLDHGFDVVVAGEAERKRGHPPFYASLMGVHIFSRCVQSASQQAQAWTKGPGWGGGGRLFPGGC